MNMTYMPSYADHHGTFSKKRMHLRPMLPIPVNYATAAVPTFAPFGTEYTPDHSIKIVGGRRISIPNSLQSMPPPAIVNSSSNVHDPDLAPTKAIQHVHDFDNAQWQQPSRSRFDTTYRTEFINRIRHPDYVPWYQQMPADSNIKSKQISKSTLNQYSILPPISTKLSSTNTLRNVGSARNAATNFPPSNKNQDFLRNEPRSNNVPPLNLNNGAQTFYQQQPPLAPPPPPPLPPQAPQPMMRNEDTYLPEEPVLLTDYEEERLAEQIRTQLGNSTNVEKLKLFYQEVAAYDPNVTSSVHYSNIKLVASQLGLNLQEDTLRFAMCKFVSPAQGRGFVNYEDMIRYFGKCLSSISPNPYDQHRSANSRKSTYDAQTRMRNGPTSLVNDDDNSNFDPDERQMRVLLKQNLKFFDMNGTIDFEKLIQELKLADRNENGLLNRQQIEEVVYKVRIPIQRSLIYHILEKHCRAYSRLYNWEAFVRYLKQQILDLKDNQHSSSSAQTQQAPTRNQWLELIRREYDEKNRLKIIDIYIRNNGGLRPEDSYSSSWFARFLRLANAMYGHRTSTNREQDFVLPREEARRLFRAYNHVWGLNLDEDKLQLVFDSCARNGNIGIDDALKVFAKQTY